MSEYGSAAAPEMKKEGKPTHSLESPSPNLESISPEERQKLVREYIENSEKNGLRKYLVITCTKILYPNKFKNYVEDCVHDALVKALKNANQFNGRSPIKIWIARIARNAALDFLKRKKVRPEILETDLVELNTSQLVDSELTSEMQETGRRLPFKDPKSLDGKSFAAILENRQLLSQLFKELTEKDKKLMILA